MEKIKEYKLLIIVLIVFSFIFYWTQMRETLIKKDCSTIVEVVPAKGEITKEQAELNKVMFEQCKLDNPGGRLFSVSSKCSLLEEGTVARPYQPEKEEIREATEEEYKTCLRQRGL
jgi:hypothetical protein